MIGKFEKLFKAKEFDFFIPQLLEDENILEELKKEFQLPTEDFLKLSDELHGQVYDFLYQHIWDCAEEIDSFEINLNEDPSEDDEYNVYSYLVRGMKGVFFIESQDEGPLFFENYENAKNYISMNFGIEFNENNEVDKRSLENRIDAATAIKRVIRIMDRLDADKR